MGKKILGIQIRKKNLLSNYCVHLKNEITLKAKKLP